MSDGGIYVLVVTLRILAGTPLLEPYDCRLWRMLLASVVQGHPSTIEEARGIFVEFPVYNCDPGKLMVNQLSEILRGFGTARNKLEKRLGFAKDQVALVSSLYANTDLNLLGLSRSLTGLRKQFRDKLQGFYVQRGPFGSAHTGFLQDQFERLAELEFKTSQRQQQKNSFEVLTVMAKSMSQRMEEDLEAEDLDFRALLTHSSCLPLVSAND